MTNFNQTPLGDPTLNSDELYRLSCPGYKVIKFHFQHNSGMCTPVGDANTGRFQRKARLPAVRRVDKLHLQGCVCYKHENMFSCKQPG
jgi:hypothetical protein